MFHFVELFKHISHRAKPHRTVLRYEELEKRILFSADSVSGLVDGAMAAQTVVVQDVGDEAYSENEASSETSVAASEETRTELVLVNDDVDDYEELIAGLRTRDENSTIEVVVLDSSRDGIEQISEILSQYQDLSALHFITHGTDGQIDIGNTRLDLETLQQYRETISGWGDSLAETGDILFYGCNVAESTSGEHFLGEIAGLTGADVSASNDITGNSNSGGDWILEYGIGSRETENLLSYSAIDEWDGVLDSETTITVTTTADTINDADGLTSLREAIIQANSTSGDVTIVLGSETYELSLTGASEDSCATGDLDISGNITIQGDGSGSTIINGSSLSDRAFHIQSGAALTLKKLTVNDFKVGSGSGGICYNLGIFTATDTVFSGGSASTGAGGAIQNEGTMTLERVSVINSTAISAGGIEQADGTLSLINVTVSGNSCSYNGAGIRISGGSATIQFSTIANNDASNGGNGGGIYLSSGSAEGTISNSIVADNLAKYSGPDIEGELASGGYNIVENSGSTFTLDSTDSSTDPDLADLALDTDSGQYVHVITSSSSAYNAADGSSTEALDQRGLARDSNPDIGAYESGASAPDESPPTTVNHSMTVSEGTSNIVLTTSFLSSTDTDADDATLIYTVSDVSNGTLMINGSAWASGTNDTFTQQDIIDGNVVYSHDGSETTSDSFTYSVADPTGNTLSGQTFTITVNSVNDVPVISSVSLSLSEGETVTLSDTNFGIADPDDSSFTYTVSSVTGGYFQFSSNTGTAITNFTSSDLSSGLVQFVDNGDENAPSFSVTVNDGDADSNTVAASITYTDENDAPVLNSANLTVSEGTTVTLNAANFGITDPDDSSFTYTVSSVTGGYFQLSSNTGTAITSFTSLDLSNGLVQFVDNGDENAPSFSVTVNDGDADSNTLAASITYTDENDAPVLNSANLTVSEGETVTLNAANFGITDPDDSSFTYTVSSVTGGYFQFSSNTGTAITSFTSSDLSSGLVQFVDNGDESGPSYSVAVNDGDADSNTVAAGITYTGVNDTPTFESTAVTSATEDTAYNYSITTSDVDGDSLTISATTLPSWLTLTDNGDGTATLTGTPTNSEVGDHSVVLTVSDGTTTTTQSFTIAVGNVNDAPTFNSTAVTSATEDTAYSYSITTSDVDGDSLTISATTLPSWLTLTDNGDGTATLTGTPTNSEVGDHSVVLTVNDGTTTTTQSFTIAVGNVNDAPTFNSTAVTSATEDTAYSYSITTSDVDGDSLTISATTLPSWLTLTDNGDGTATLTGTPTNSEVGDHSVVLTVSDGTTTATQSFTIAVGNVNDAPTFNSTAVTSATEDTAYSYSITTSDVDGDSLTISATTIPSWLTLTDNGDGTATLTGTPTNTEVGDHSVVLTVNDGTTTTTQSFTIAVGNTNDAPTFDSTAVTSATEDTAYNYNITTSDVDGDGLTIAAATLPSWLTLTDNGDGTATLTGTPTNSEVGDHSVVLTVSDGTTTTTQSFTIAVGNTNDAPTFDSTAVTSATEDSAYSYSITTSDVDGDSLTISATTLPSWLSLTDNGDSTATLTGTPTNSEVGEHSVVLTVSDGTTTTTQSFTIAVGNTNDAPTFDSTAVTSATEDSAYSYSITTSDVDGDSLTISAATLPSWLSLTDNGDGTATLTGTPTNSEVGDHSVVLTVSDGTTTTTQSFIIAVGNVNDAPTFDSTAVTSATEDTAYSYSITTSDVDGDGLTIAATTLPSWLTLIDNGDGTATLTGTPTNSEVGNHSVVLTVSDGTTTTTQSFTIAVGNVNDAPTFDTTAVTSATEDTAYNYNITASDADGDGLTIAATTLPSWLTLTDNGDGTATLTGTPTNSEVGDHSVVLTVSDGTTTTTQSFTIVVGNVNDAPTFDSTAVTSATEDSAYSYSITTSDVDGDSLTISTTTLPSWLSLTDNSDGTATLTGTPTNSEVGNHSVVLTVSDGTTTTTQSFTITVSNTNDAPTFDSTAVTSATEDTAYNYNITASDADGDGLTIAATTLPSWLTLTDNGDGTATLTGTPTNSEVGDHSVVLTVSDGTTTTTQSFTIAVGNMNDAPTFDSTAITSATEDSTYSYSITASDVDGDSLAITATTLPSWLTLTDNGDGTATLTGTPTNSEVGDHSVVLTVSDGTTTTTQSFTIAVGNTNDAPTFDSTATTSATEDSAYSYTIATSDVDGDSLAITATTLPSWLTLTDNGDGTATLTGIPTNSEVGNHGVVLTVSDGATTATQSFTIAVGNVNDAPTFDSTAVTSATEDTAYSYSITTSDVDGDSLTISATTLPAWLTLTDNGDGTATLTGTPTNTEVGDHSVVLTVNDGTTTTTQSFTIAVGNTNDAPTFDSTAVTSATEDTAYNYNITTSDVDGDGLTIAATTLPSWLTLTDNGDGTATLTGTPTNSEVGDHSVVLTVSDGTTTTTQSFTIAVGNVNDAPTFDSTAVTSATEDTAYSYSITTSDVDGDSLTISATTLPSWLTLTDNGDGTATLTGTPTNSEVGDHSVVLTVSDGTTTTTQSFTIAVGNVNDAPTFDSTAVTSATEDTAYSYTITTSDVDGDSLTISATTLPSWLTLTDNGDGTATLTGTPTNSEVGDHSVVLTVNDGTTTTTQSFTIAVGNVNDAPTFNSTAVTSATEDTAYSYSITTSDVDGDSLTISATTLPSWLTLTDNGDGTATLTGTPTNSEVGDHSVVLTVSDGTTTTTQSFTIAVGNTNDAPTFDSTAVTSATEDTAYSYSITTSDVDGDGLTIAAATLPSWLTLTDNGDGTATLTGTPTNSEIGDHSVVLTVSDGTTTTTQSFTIAVGNTNDAPTFDSTAVTSATEDTVYNYNITTSDVDGDGLTIAAATLPSWLTLTDNGDGTATLSGTPTNSEVGNHGVVLTVSDGTTTTTQSFTIAVGNTNDAPTFDSTAITSATEDSTYSYSITTSDVDGDSLAITATTLPSWLTLTDNGDGTATLTGTPTNSEVGDHSVVLTVSDGATTATQSFTITVSNTNDAPVATNDTAQVDEDTSLAGNVLANDSDVDGDSLTASLINDVSHGSFTLNADGSFSYTANADFNGTDSVTYEITDGNGGTSRATVIITVNAVNDAPLFESTAVTTATESVAYNYTIITDDVDLDGVAITAATLPSWLTLTDNGDGTATLTGTPTNSEIGDHNVVLTVSDGSSTVIQTFAVTVSADHDNGGTKMPDNDSSPPKTDDDLLPGENNGADPVGPDDNDSDDSSDKSLIDPIDTGQEDQSPVSPIASDQIDPDIIFLNNNSKRTIEHKHNRDYRFYSIDPEEIDIDSEFISNFDAASSSQPFSQEHEKFKQINGLDIASNHSGSSISYTRYDQLRSEIDTSFSEEQRNVSVKSMIGSVLMESFTVGFVSYLLRPGALIANWLATLPLWRGFDPIAVLAGEKKEKSSETESESESENLFDGDTR